MQIIIEEFLRYLQFEKRLAKLTYTAYRKDLLDFNDYLQRIYDIQAITAIQLIHVRSWVYELKTNDAFANTSIHRKASALNSFFKYCLKEGYITDNPARLLQLPKKEKRLPVFVPEKKMDFILDEIDFSTFSEPELNRMILVVLYFTGMRRSELVALKWSDIDYARGYINVIGKRAKHRLIPIVTLLQHELETYKKYSLDKFGFLPEYLLTLSTSKRVDVNYVYRTVKKYLSMVTTLDKKSPHVLRHTFATHLLNNGADISAIQQLLGHDSLASTQVYTQMHIEHLKAVYRKAHPKS